ncbi:uncharacterized protein FIBRA_03521 [Fibroporia radiculosa]|uniref:Translation elongation factor EFTu-like domain-containing protein n=1 Tax=Fibroporia radiculosa TaxID=599839 RepID=J4HW14_9APHY|nr:uncharacterized protein FIBRA_03521 [Fibroporia radiculosa]CCM01467.1 predicted protein [Fibroporia radiculosa]
MTTLRNFQNEIDEIQHRELIKQRTQYHTEQGKEKGPRNAVDKSVSESKANKNGDIVVDPSEPQIDIDAPDTSDLDERIQGLLLSDTLSDKERARDILTALLTRRRGEYILRIGDHPPNSKLFAGESLAEIDGWYGTPCTAQDLVVLQKETSRIVDDLGGQTTILFESKAEHPRAALLLRLPPADVSLTPEVRCAVVGNVDSGKSTTLGVLTRGALDDGRGRARVSLFRHKHEIESGRTSSVGMEILGFDVSGKPILPPTAHSNDLDVIRREKMGWEDISARAAKIVSFIGANAGLIGMSKEHLAIALALSVPVVVCITKIDMTPPNVLAKTIEQVCKIMKSPGCRKTPVFVKSAETAVELRMFLNLLPASESDSEKFAADQPLEYSVTEIWSVPYVGTVVDGILNSGTIKTGDTVLLGPDANGNYQTTVIKSIQRKRAPVGSAEAGQCVSLALKRVRKAAVRKGMVLVHKTDTLPRAVRRFEGQVLILYHNTTLQTNYQAMLHCGAVRQTVRIVSMDHPQGILRTGDRATVTFEFIARPEFIKEGMKLLFREGKTKGLGVITRLL